MFYIMFRDAHKQRTHDMLKKDSSNGIDSDLASDFRECHTLRDSRTLSAMKSILLSADNRAWYSRITVAGFVCVCGAHDAIKHTLCNMLCYARVCIVP